MEVALKRKEWAKLRKRARVEAIANHCFPAVLGPDDRFYIVDHHHFGLALPEEDVSKISLMVLKDLSTLAQGEFWRVMDHHQWVHPYDQNGVRRTFSGIPSHLTKLRDDPYRSLAGELRRAGGYAKDAQPFSEFLWADFFRSRIRRNALQQDFPRQLRVAQKLARGSAAHYLPGWAGRHVER